ncbi:hypothetical protein [Janthinobacterium sp.]|uniref:hypothetical protein n=1 Tax=Janthinobacterium sp. TaxID=1871054 RepID=UPI00293D89DE|nr:hypothetical protein [Janthinobacterium sp.]
MHYTPHTESHDASQERHAQLAVARTALHIAHLAIARWSGGDWQSDAPPASAQSRWLAARDQDFMLWLAAGGFAQADAPAVDEPAPLRACAV